MIGRDIQRSMNFPARVRALSAVGSAMLCVALLPGAADAADAVRYDQRGAAGVCAPSLPVHAAGLRARPLGLANEGTTEVFVTCTFVGSSAGGRATERITLNVANFGPAARVVTCTLVDGFASGSMVSATYSPKSVQVFPGSLGAFIEWIDSPSTPAAVQRAAVQCRLPSRTALQYIATRYFENVGN